MEKQIPDTMAARGLTREQVIKDVLLAAQPTKQFVTVEEDRGLGALSGLRHGPLHHRRDPVHRRRLDGRLRPRPSLTLRAFVAFAGPLDLLIRFANRFSWTAA